MRWNSVECLSGSLVEQYHSFSRHGAPHYVHISVGKKGQTRFKRLGFCV